MITITGKPVCSGVAFGPVFVFSREESTIKRHHIESSDDEIARFESARQQTISELAMLYDKALAEVGEANAMIFQIHQMMLDDLDYIESIKNIITDQLINAETAVAQTCDNFVQMFRAMDDPYMRERSADVKDVSERLIKILSGKDKDGLVTDEPVIIISDDLAPSETVQFDKSKILAFVTEGGSTNSHTSILARMMNIPAMIGAKGVLSADANGKNAIVDGFTGTIYIDPDEATINEMTKKKEEIDKQNKLLQQLKGRESVTKDGQTTSFYFSRVYPQETITLTTGAAAAAGAGSGQQAVTFSFEYENEKGTVYNASEDVFLEIYQPAQAVLEGFVLASKVYSQETVETAVRIRNTGKAAIYQARIELNAPGLFAMEEVIAGNVEAGAVFDGSMRIYVGNKNMESISQYDAEAGEDAYGQTAGTLTLTYEDADGEVYTQTQEFTTVIEKPQIVELTVEKETVQTNEWYGAVLVLLVLLFLLIIAILGLRLKRSRDRLADLLAAKKKEQSG